MPHGVELGVRLLPRLGPSRPCKRLHASSSLCVEGPVGARCPVESLPGVLLHRLVARPVARRKTEPEPRDAPRRVRPPERRHVQTGGLQGRGGGGRSGGKRRGPYDPGRRRPGVEGRDRVRPGREIPRERADEAGHPPLGREPENHLHRRRNGASRHYRGERLRYLRVHHHRIGNGLRPPHLHRGDPRPRLRFDAGHRGNIFNSHAVFGILVESSRTAARPGTASGATSSRNRRPGPSRTRDIPIPA